MHNQHPLSVCCRFHRSCNKRCCSTPSQRRWNGWKHVWRYVTHLWGVFCSSPSHKTKSKRLKQEWSQAKSYCSCLFTSNVRKCCSHVAHNVGLRLCYALSSFPKVHLPWAKVLFEMWTQEVGFCGASFSVNLLASLRCVQTFCPFLMLLFLCERLLLETATQGNLRQPHLSCLSVGIYSKCCSLHSRSRLPWHPWSLFIWQTAQCSTATLHCAAYTIMQSAYSAIYYDCNWLEKIITV